MEVEMPEDKWWEIHENVYTFARHLVEIEDMDIENLLYFIEKPWKWDPEYQEYMKLPRIL